MHPPTIHSFISKLSSDCCYLFETAEVPGLDSTRMYRFNSIPPMYFELTAPWCVIYNNFMLVVVSLIHYSQGFCVNNSVSKNHHNA